MGRRVLDTLASVGVLLLIAGCIAIVSRAVPNGRAARDHASVPVAGRVRTAAPQTRRTISVRPATPTSAVAAPRTARPATQDPRTALMKALNALPKGSVSAAAVDLDNGTRYAGGSASGQWMASVYKLLVVHLLWIGQHGFLTDAERSDAAAAIEHSDNAAGYRLFLDLGGDAGLRAGIAGLHLTHTTPGNTDPTFTTTSAADCVTLLRSVLTDSYALSLMRGVEADQRWGVGSVPGARDVVNKNGWLSVDDENGPGENDAGRWVVNSLGIETLHGHRIALAVLTQHNADLDDGIALVERLARLAAAAVVTP